MEGGLDAKVTVTARGVVAKASSKGAICVVAMASTREVIEVGITVTARGVVKAEAGARVKAELGLGVPGDEGVAIIILQNCNNSKVVLKR